MKTLIISVLLLVSYYSYSQNVVIVIIDGLRYTESFADKNSTYTPQMWQMSEEGTLLSEFYNNQQTYTSAAIPALWCGAWTNRIDTVYNGKSTRYSELPSIFEYFRKQKDIPMEKCLYSLKYVESLWLQSFSHEYGPDYWPFTISEGSNDREVLENTITYMDEHRPQLTVMYLADVDHGGHSGNWNTYTESITTADHVVHELWNELNDNAFYKGTTTMFVTNDHGRHDDNHGGFKGHGDGCDGCRHIMMMALGKGVRKGFVSDQYRTIPDVAVTAASILDVQMEHASGEVISELFETTSIERNQEKIEWNIQGDQVILHNTTAKKYCLHVFNSVGQVIKEISIDANKGLARVNWGADLPGEFYILQLSTDTGREHKKIWKLE